MLCVVGNKLYSEYLIASNSFTGDYYNAEHWRDRQDAIDKFLVSFSAYKNHVDHCLECNINDREML